MATSPARTKRKSPSAANVDPAKKASAPDPAGTGTSTIRLPFVTASFHRGSRAPRAPRPVGPGAPGAPWTPQASVGQAVASLRSPLPLSRLAFYGAAVALGVLEVVEWPVTLLVVAGTYLTDRATSTDNAADSPVSAAADLVVPSPAEQHAAGGGGPPASPSSTGADPSAPPPARAASDLVVPSPVEQHTGGAS